LTICWLLGDRRCTVCDHCRDAGWLQHWLLCSWRCVRVVLCYPCTCNTVNIMLFSLLFYSVDIKRKDHYLFYHQGYICRISYPSNKLCFIRRMLNKPCTRNPLGQCPNVVLCIIFSAFHLLFRQICLIF